MESLEQTTLTADHTDYNMANISMALANMSMEHDALCMPNASHHVLEVGMSDNCKIGVIDGLYHEHVLPNVSQDVLSLSNPVQADVNNGVHKHAHQYAYKKKHKRQEKRIQELSHPNMKIRTRESVLAAKIQMMRTLQVNNGHRPLHDHTKQSYLSMFNDKTYRFQFDRFDAESHALIASHMDDDTIIDFLTLREKEMDIYRQELEQRRSAVSTTKTLYNVMIPQHQNSYFSRLYQDTYHYDLGVRAIQKSNN